jgi:hypothetical protein
MGSDVNNPVGITQEGAVVASSGTAPGSSPNPVCRNPKPGLSAPNPAVGGASPSSAIAADRRLMLLIHSRWGAAILTACRYSAILPEFLAALVANETGGDNTKPPRFEEPAYLHLCAVQAGEASPADVLHHRPAHYGSIVQHQLLGFSDAELRALASSWGLTQVMGYHVLTDPHIASGAPANPQRLADPGVSLPYSLGLLGGFVKEFGLQPKCDFECLFRCWNTGQPHGKTFDPQYVENGLRRLVIYREVQES